MRLKTEGLVEVWPYKTRDKLDPKVEHRHDANVLTKDGVALLQRTYPGYVPFWTPATGSIVSRYGRHDQLINEVSVALLSAASWDGYQLERYIGDYQLGTIAKDGRTHLMEADGSWGVEPDAFFVLRKTERSYPFFLEIDLSNESVATVIRRKLLKYGDYLKNRYRDDLLFHGTDHPRVLFVTESKARLQHILGVADEMGLKNAYCFTTLDHFLLTEKRVKAEGAARATVSWLGYNPLDTWFKANQPESFALFD